MTIILYDLHSNITGGAWSPSVWKIRYALNLKGINHRTEFVEMVDLEGLYQKLGLTPTVKGADGTLRCSVPVIFDESTNTCLTDSIVIAEYLEKKYPEPQLFPHNSKALQLLIEPQFLEYTKALRRIIMPRTAELLSPSSREFYLTKRIPAFAGVDDGVSVEERWAQYRDGLEKAVQLYRKVNGPFIMGDIVSWADIVVAACLAWQKQVFGERSREWSDLMSWHGGRWAQLMEALSPYEAIL